MVLKSQHAKIVEDKAIEFKKITTTKNSPVFERHRDYYATCKGLTEEREQ